MLDTVERVLHCTGYVLLLATVVAAYYASLHPRKAVGPSGSFDFRLEKLIHFLAYLILVVAAVCALAATRNQ